MRLLYKDLPILTEISFSKSRQFLRRICFLQQAVPCVFFIMENIQDRTLLPIRSLISRRDIHFTDSLCYTRDALSLQGHIKNFFDNFCFFRVDFQSSICQHVTKRCFIGGKSALVNSSLVTPPHSFGDGLALPLGQCREHGDKNFAGHLRGVNVLLLKVDADVERLQFPYSRQTFLGIPGEAGG